RRHSLGESRASSRGQPFCRTPGVTQTGAPRALAFHRVLALDLSRTLDLGSHRAVSEMTKVTTPLLGLVMTLAALFSLQVGSASIPWVAGRRDCLTGQGSLAGLVTGEIRRPRTLLALVVGAALGLSGAALQGLLRNPPADPALTGASSGAALGAATVFYY